MNVRGVRSLDHIGITVPALEPAVEFFRSVLGADLLYTAGPWPDPDGAWMPDTLDVRDRTSLRLAMLRFGPYTNLELLEFGGGDEEPADLARIGTAHLALHVDDVAAAAADLGRVDGVHVLAGPTTLPAGEPSAGLTYLYARTPWVFLELVSWSPGMPYEQHTAERMLPPAPAWTWRPERVGPDRSG